MTLRASLCILALAAAAVAETGYHITQRIPIEGEGGWDYLMVDSSARRVYVSHASEVVVIDADSGVVVGKISGLKGVHGIALAPKLKRGFISNGQAGTVTVFDLATLEHIGEDIKAGQNPDAILFDPASERVFAFNSRSSNATAIDAATGTVAGTIPLGGKPEFAASDGRNSVFVNIEDKSQLVQIDAKKLTVLHTWPLTGCEEPSGLSIDRAAHRLFAGRHNNVMAVVNADNGKVVATPPICQGIDATWFDSGAHIVFNSCGDGTVTALHEDSPDTYTLAETVKTQTGSRTMAVDEKTHKLFLPAAQFEQAPPGPGEQRPRRKMVAARSRCSY